MSAYTGKDKRLKYLFDNTSGGSSKVWIGTQAEYEAQVSRIENGTLVTITDDEQEITQAEQEAF